MGIGRMQRGRGAAGGDGAPRKLDGKRPKKKCELSFLQNFAVNSDTLAHW